MSKWTPRGFGGKRVDPEIIKRDSWQTLGILVIDVRDQRLAWQEAQLIKQLGDRLFASSKRGLQ